MVHTVTTHGEVRADHTLTVRMPDDVPTGPVLVTVTVNPELPDRIATLGDFLGSEFFGAWADYDDLPKTNEEFAAWRKKIWDGESA